MIVIYYTNQDGTIDSFHKFEGTVAAANLFVAEHNAKWSIQTARAVYFPEGSFFEYLYLKTIEYLNTQAMVNRKLQELSTASPAQVEERVLELLDVLEPLEG